jgi:excisionase family DNA binding protein
MTDRPKLLLTPREAADALSVCEKTLWSMTAPRGDLRPTKIGRAVRYSVAELERWIAEQQRVEVAT